MSHPNGKPRRQLSDSPRIDRLPPHSPEAEQFVLGSILVNCDVAIPNAITVIKDGAKEFYDLRHQTMYQLALEMWDRKLQVQVLSLFQYLKDRQLADEIGGHAYLSEVSDVVTSVQQTEQYANVVHEKYLLRRMISACTDAVGRIYNFEGEPNQIIDETERSILDVRRSQTSEETPSITVLISNNIETIEKYHERKGSVMGLPTGFVDLDKMTCGLQPGEMIVIAARPSMGKTSLAMNIAEHITVDQKEPVSVFSLEMRAEALSLRMLCSRARVNIRSVREGFLAERDFPKLTNSASKISNAPLYIDDCPDKSLMRIRTMARRHHQVYGIKLIVIDYMQLMHDPSRRYGNREQEIAGISGGVKSIAQELNIPVIVLSQLNREFERDKSRRPRLSDLRESGAIEQDADFVGLLYKPKADDDENHCGVEEDAIPINLLIAKQRNGPAPCDIHLTFLKSFTRFESAAKVCDDDVPNDAQADMNYNNRTPYPD